MKFEEMSFDDEFDGVWACASLLHVPSEDIKDVFGKIYMALYPKGIFYSSFKYGDGMLQRGERVFNDFTEDRIKKSLIEVGFEIIECDTSFDVRPGREEEKWVNVIAKKINSLLR